ncbi:GntR family transcriptional regulator [Noviherbaspirillum saxi]|uniref:GntR family transcriptional regulator n=1 Tax=Noviherbaspirillum saxi TaxID=2320863 RepID=A0A3A3FM37_9BURK|nr:GntR family transcriptional regulator [Noviherbaspirillum saxi]RJF96254.1 GntR family transcriptional regulator [Noviherbaspirillum saxi]
MKLPTKLHYADIARHLTEGIAAGQFPVGSLLPTEMELCDHYKTSRHTIRAALHELQQLGLVSRRKNVGTRVEAVRPTNEFRPTLSSIDDLVQFGSEHIRKVLSVEETTIRGALAKELTCDSGSKWLRISSLRIDANDRPPVGWTDVYIEPAYAEIGELIRKSPDTLISSMIEERYGRRIAQIRQEIRAVAVPENMAPLLQAEPNAPALKIIRWYQDAGGQVFEMSVSVHPSERFAVSMQLQRSNQ